MIKTILFDVGNVLVPIDFHRCHDALAKVCPYPPEEIPKRIRATGLVGRFEKGQIPPEEFVEACSLALGIQLGFDQFWELWSAIFLPETLIPEDWIEGLHRRYRLLLLSNTNVVHFALVRQRYPLIRHFDGQVLSYEVGALKPSPQIYREAIARSGCRPEECFFTDDMVSFVEAARQHGMDAVQFQDWEQLKSELQARSIAW